MKPYIRSENGKKFDVINFRIVRLPNREYTVQAQRQFFFKTVKIWTNIAEYGGDRFYSTEYLDDAEKSVKKWRNYYEQQAEEKITSKSIISTTEVRKRDTHPEHFV